MTRDEIIQKLKDRNPGTKQFVENGISRESLLGPKEQEHLFGIYAALFKPKVGVFNSVASKLVDFLTETYELTRLEAAAMARANAENSMMYFRDFRDNKVFEDAEDIIQASLLFAYWDLLRYVMGLKGFETLN